MKGQQARLFLRRWGARALPVTLTLLGLLCIKAALEPPLVHLGTTTHHWAAEASVRGQASAGRQWLSLRNQVAAVIQPAATVTAEAPIALGVGGPLEMALGVGALAEITATPTVAAPSSPTPTPPRTEVIDYTVEQGDNVFLIAQKFHVSQDTIIWANDPLEMDPDLLSVGQVLKILPVTGAQYTVKAGDTIAAVAARFQVSPDAITNYEPNKLTAASSLQAGQTIMIPGGIKPFEPHLVYTRLGLVTTNAQAQPGKFIWPTHGVITQYFNKDTHHGIDIANNAGTPILAAAAGVVTAAGWQGSLGNAVFINHGDGYVTWYGHMRKLLVKAGQKVARGQQIGEMGTTGQSTGPHLHFVVMVQGGAVNPIRYLP